MIPHLCLSLSLSLSLSHLPRPTTLSSSSQETPWYTERDIPSKHIQPLSVLTKVDTTGLVMRDPFKTATDYVRERVEKEKKEREDAKQERIAKKRKAKLIILRWGDWTRLRHQQITVVLRCARLLLTSPRVPPLARTPSPCKHTRTHAKTYTGRN